MNFPLGQGLANASDHLCQRFVTIGPAGDGFVVTGKRLQLSQWGVFPIHRAHEDGNDTGCTGLMSPYGFLELDSPAIVGGEEVRTDEQENHAGRLQMAIDLVRPFCSRHDLAVVPGGDESLPLQETQMFLQFNFPELIFGSIGKEHFCSCCHSTHLFQSSQQIA